jgi:hypothetical protein
VHYGGDSGRTDGYRKGTLYFYNNTLISHKPGMQHIFQIETSDEKVFAMNNIFYMDGEDIALASRNSGVFTVKNNWISAGWKMATHGEAPGNYAFNVEDMAEGVWPGFINLATEDYALKAAAACRRLGKPLPADLQERHPVEYQYRADGIAVKRTGMNDLGALEGNN